MIRSQKIPVRPSVYNPSTPNETSPGDIHSYVGKMLILNHHQILVEDILGQGGFAFVFRVRTYNQQRYALKRMYVNNQRDLTICQREVALLKEFSSHRNIIQYVDHSINRISKQYSDEDTIYEILLLTEYCLNGSLIVSFDICLSSDVQTTDI
jgi:AP2-associated kinase